MTSPTNAQDNAILAPLTSAGRRRPRRMSWTIRNRSPTCTRCGRAGAHRNARPRAVRQLVAITTGVLDPTYEGAPPPVRRLAGDGKASHQGIGRPPPASSFETPLSPSLPTGQPVEHRHAPALVDALGLAQYPRTGCATSRPGHAHRSWSYTSRGRRLPDVPVQARRTNRPPAGTSGPEDAADTVHGTALDFCLLVTQRRHRADVAVRAQGPAARVARPGPGLRLPIDVVRRGSSRGPPSAPPPGPPPAPQSAPPSSTAR